MTNIEKVERALAFAKEVNLNDEQVKELMAMVLGLVNLKFNIVPSTPTPLIPWAPSPFTPGWPNDGTIISYGMGVVMQPSSEGSFQDFVEGRCTSTSFPPQEIITTTIDLSPKCACSPRGQPHSDSCKALGINQ